MKMVPICSKFCILYHIKNQPKSDEWNMVKIALEWSMVNVKNLSKFSPYPHGCNLFHPILQLFMHYNSLCWCYSIRAWSQWGFLFNLGIVHIPFGSCSCTNNAIKRKSNMENFIFYPALAMTIDTK